MGGSDIGGEEGGETLLKVWQAESGESAVLVAE